VFLTPTSHHQRNSSVRKFKPLRALKPPKHGHPDTASPKSVLSQVSNSTLCIFRPGNSVFLSRCAVRSLGGERITELPNYLEVLKCPSAQSVGKRFGQTGAPKAANELGRAELRQPTSPIRLPTPGHPKLGCAIEMPAVRKEIPWC
jgi:hypothetical protein